MASPTDDPAVLDVFYLLPGEMALPEAVEIGHIDVAYPDEEDL